MFYQAGRKSAVTALTQQDNSSAQEKNTRIGLHDPGCECSMLYVPWPVSVTFCAKHSLSLGRARDRLEIRYFAATPVTVPSESDCLVALSVHVMVMVRVFRPCWKRGLPVGTENGCKDRQETLCRGH